MLLKKIKLVELRNNNIHAVTHLRKNSHFFNNNTLVVEWSKENNCYFVTTRQTSEFRYTMLEEEIVPGKMRELESGAQIWVENLASKEKILLAAMAENDRYLLGQVIGQNTAKTKFTCKALDIDLRSRVIIKLQRIEANTVELMRVNKFRRSAQAHSRLTSPYLAQLRDVGEIVIYDVVYEYQVYDYFIGKSLVDWKEENPPSGEDANGKAVKIFHQVSLALQDMHTLQIAHRNLNEKHILVDDSGRVHIVGLSLIKGEDAQFTLSGEIIGDVRLCPVSIDNPFERDIYAMIVLFLYTLILEFDLQKIQFPLTVEKNIKSSLPASLVEVIDCVLNKKFPCITEVVCAFAEAAKFAPHNINRKQQYLIVPNIDEIEMPVGIEVWCQQLEEIGGDFYDVVSAQKNKLGILMGDAMGHGIRASLYCHMVQPVARILSSNRLAAPFEILSQMNSLLYRNKGEMKFAAFATAQYAELTISETSKYMVYGNAGHLTPIICRDGKALLARPGEVIFSGNQLGFCDNKNFRIFEHCVDLHSGDYVIFYTDGIVEAMNEENEQYSQERLLNTLSHTFLNVSDLMEKIKQDVLSFSNDRYSDDVTCLAIEIH